MEIKILLFCTAMAFNTVLADNCKAPYVRIGDGCYFISNDKVSGDAAFALCAKRGAYLANFETLEEAMIMKMELQQKNSGLHYYVGGRNINRYVTGGDWRWIKNELMTKMTYYAFGDGEPNGSIASPQDCMYFYALNIYHFYNVMCDSGTNIGGYICEN
ncbi:C-type lectin domain family 4 member M-like [Mytilus californianus]|uniref:C-type lectin domain family 4 member M-like n=1 Tax=Mytilus californianus TaxID=6549 RepID=UPI002246092C|nr:C-type lectin domain family 4 member M-like [Mytilus californianus]